MAVIAGVRIRSLQPHADERGSLTELLRSDWPEFTRFGQAILTVNEPGVIRGWHWHHEQTDVIVVITGRVVIPLYDGRAESPTHGAVEEYLSDDGDRFALFVPPGVFHGYRTVGTNAALIVNLPDRVYDPSRPDEVRIDPFSPEVPYAWPAPARDPAHID